MAEPSADGIDVDSGAQEMSGAGMANGVRRWPFTVQFRKTIFQRARMARNDFMNAKARKQLTASVHEDALIARANVYQHLNSAAVEAHRGHSCPKQVGVGVTAKKQALL